MAQENSTKKYNKPLIEKRRRDRINNCLAQIKDLIVGDLNIGISHPNKMEKADILEMAVQYLQNHRNAHSSEFTNLSESYRMGYVDCLNRTVNYLETISPTPLNPLDLLQHLLKNYHSIQEEFKENASFSTERNERDIILIQNSQEQSGYLCKTKCVLEAEDIAFSSNSSFEMNGDNPKTESFSSRDSIVMTGGFYKNESDLNTSNIDMWRPW